MGSRRVGARGWIFIVLLLVSAGMVTVPGGQDTAEEVRAFYTEHAAVVVLANVVSVLGAFAFWLFARALHDEAPGARGVRTAGALVAAAAALTSVPVLLLCALADGARGATLHDLAVASDLTDVLLFSAIAGFAAATARSSTGVVLTVVAVLVAGLSSLRALLLLFGSDLLELVAPMSFVLLVAVLSSMSLLRRPWHGASS